MKKKNKPERFDEMQESIRGKAYKYAYSTSLALSALLFAYSIFTEAQLFNIALPKHFLLFGTSALFIIPANIFNIYTIIKGADESRLDTSSMGSYIAMIIVYTLNLILHSINSTYSEVSKILFAIIVVDIIFLYSLRIIKKRIATKNFQKDYKEHQQENDE